MKLIFTIAEHTKKSADARMPELSPSQTPALQQVISARVAESCSQAYGSSLRGVILTGSLARDEATLVPEALAWRLLGDAEFLLVFRDGAKLPQKESIASLREKTEHSLLGAGIAGQVDFSAVHAGYLRELGPDIFAYELRNCGRVILGDRKILGDIADFPPQKISLEDAWRLLSNRMLEHLDTFEEAARRPRTLTLGAFYRTVKLYLDLATSFLVFAGMYAPTYLERAERLKELAAAPPQRVKAPFDLARFSDHVSECTEWKISSDRSRRSRFALGLSASDFDWWQEAAHCALALWHWELVRLAAGKETDSLNRLVKRWMRCQPLPKRIRGWLYVARDLGWHRSWKNWPRWARLARRASPRYWLYAVTNEIFCNASSLSGTGCSPRNGGTNWTKMRSCLPVVPRVEEWRELPDPVRLAKEIAWNYSRFLVRTRA
jgi:hypothetical protein